jgi:gamma-glutamyl phosphate reductase
MNLAVFHVQSRSSTKYNTKTIKFHEKKWGKIFATLCIDKKFLETVTKCILFVNRTNSKKANRIFTSKYIMKKRKIFANYIPFNF